MSTCVTGAPLNVDIDSVSVSGAPHYHWAPLNVDIDSVSVSGLPTTTVSSSTLRLLSHTLS
ncbi:hypothetical protein J6590_003724 [Homalodisca vitripennis]|nr:hypothetical protein J6590_003724 [Homalodisca vitripennis]